MTLSIVIVSYNVKFFLEQCLSSVRNACSELDYEIIVVDNASSDNSKDYFEARNLPRLRWIQNAENVGFSIANNQAFAICKGQYILILNPDTILDDGGLKTALVYLAEHKDVGALGMKMVDGGGDYLPESKRGMPSLWATLFKMTGVYKLFPSHPFFNSYYRGELDKDQLAEIEVLSGACMLVRAEVLHEVGGFDERYFMYAEDIDLSYSIRKAGYRVMYFPSCQVIHFKGESTKKRARSFSKSFYDSMILFLKKYNGELYHPLEVIMFELAVGVVSFLHYISLNIRGLLPLAWVWFLGYGAYFAISSLWATQYHDDVHYFPAEMRTKMLPMVATVWAFVSLYFVYFSRLSILHKWSRISLWSTILVTLLYSMLSEDLRFSRGVLILGSIATFVLGLATAGIAKRMKEGTWSNVFYSRSRALVVGTQETYLKLKNKLADQESQGRTLVGFVDFRAQSTQDLTVGTDYLGSMSQGSEVVSQGLVDEVLFVIDEVRISDILQFMTKTGNEVKYSLLAMENNALLSSDSSSSQGSVVSLDVQLRFSEGHNRFLKRVIDVSVASLALIVSPFWGFGKPSVRKIAELWSVLIGNATLVGADWTRFHIPGSVAKSVVINIEDPKVRTSDNIKGEVFNYLRNYSPWMDIKIIFANFSHIIRSL